MTEALEDPLFVDKFSAYIDSVTPPVPFLAESSPTPSMCPMPNCTGTLEPLPFPCEAFCRRRADQTPAKTSHCPQCETSFAHKDVLLHRIHAFAAFHKIPIDELAVERFRCQPPDLPSETGILSNLELVYLALSLLDYQVHHETHTKSCFKITSRTPHGMICRYFFPRLARLQATIIDIASGKIISHRPLGCEYYNICSLLWTRLTKSNMDIQFLINGGDRRTTSYSTKYTFKAQKPASALTLKIGLLTEVHKRTLISPDDGNLSPLERGRRAINKALYQFTKPQELHLTMAAYILLNDGPFVRSHEPVYINLKQLCAGIPDGDDRSSDPSYLDTDDDKEEDDEAEEDSNDEEDDSSDGEEGEDEDEDEEEDEEEEDDEEMEPEGNDGSDVDDGRDGEHDEDQDSNSEDEFEDEIPDRDGYVNVQVSKFSLRAQAKADENSNEKEEEANEADNYLDEVCLLTDYWYRPASMKDMHFAYVREHFHIVKSKPSDKSGMAMQLGHPNPEKRYWRRNENHERQCLIFSGGKVNLLLQ